MLLSSRFLGYLPSGYPKHPFFWIHSHYRPYIAYVLCLILSSCGHSPGQQNTHLISFSPVSLYISFSHSWPSIPTHPYISCILDDLIYNKNNWAEQFFSSLYFLIHYTLRPSFPLFISFRGFIWYLVLNFARASLLYYLFKSTVAAEL